MSRPIKMARPPDGTRAPKRPRKPVRTWAEMRADLCRGLERATHPLDITLKCRALARMDQEEADWVVCNRRADRVLRLKQKEIQP